MIAAQNVCFSYTGSPPYVLSDINFELCAGEYVSVVGDNGSGKSTLIKLILKFLKPTDGKMIVDAGKIGYVPQKNDFSGSHFPITVYEALNSYRKLLRIKNRNEITEALARVGMAGSENALMGTLSGGQSQKIMIARALLGSPELLVLDEPSTGVDADSQREIYGFIRKINEQQRITIVSVEHNLDAAIESSTLIYHLQAGRGHLCSVQHYAEELLRRKREVRGNA